MVETTLLKEHVISGRFGWFPPVRVEIGDRVVGVFPKESAWEKQELELTGEDFRLKKLKIKIFAGENSNLTS